MTPLPRPPANPGPGLARRRAWVWAWVGSALLFALGGCSALPARTPEAAGATPGRVNVQGAQGELSREQRRATLLNVAAEGRHALFEHHLRTLTRSGDADLYRGNRTRLLVDGPATFAAMKAAIAQARHRVLLQSYIFEDQGVAADVAELLLQRAAQGVQVRVIYDAVGSITTPTEFFKRLTDGGVGVCEFNPINPVRRPGHWSITHRDHRKLLVVDQDAAFTGGINISRVYGSGSAALRRSAPARTKDADDDGWRDTQIELRGPVVPAIAQVFEDTWREQGCKGELPAAQGRPAAPEPGDRVVKVLASDPRDEGNRIYTALLAAIDAAQQEVHIAMAYFAPGEAFVQALCDAAQRGVSVALVLPGRSDSRLALHAGRSYYTRLLQAGVRIHEMDQAVMHAKTAVIDGVFSTVGSSNLDWLSFVANNELNVIVLGDEFGSRMNALFDKDRRESRPVALEDWQRRGLGQRVMEGVGRLMERWL
ncbi:MAG: cardiolipin synthase B [Hydrogenophaga sp.]|uniref:phospholipase D-like domain-containing protein n=1 Tax=Hydrogenophaga sp. TaxID=1904254 RepID=UPI002580667D|nr:phospholipase D-like domain-containing protein [Hydrogenophaga sp.]MBL0945502.1 cardiolipin synthase B [Hydrogenophaga sp.]